MLAKFGAPALYYFLRTTLAIAVCVTKPERKIVRHDHPFVLFVIFPFSPGFRVSIVLRHVEPYIVIRIFDLASLFLSFLCFPPPIFVVFYFPPYHFYPRATVVEALISYFCRIKIGPDFPLSSRIR